MSVPNANRGVHPARRGSVRVLSGCGLDRFRKGVFEESLSLFTTHAREPLEELLKRVPCLQVRYQTVHGNPRAGKHGHASHYFRIGVVYPPLIHRAIIYQPVRNLMSIDCFSTPPPRTTCRGGVCQPFRPIGWAIIAEGSLSFLGFGLRPDLPSWGTMLSCGGRQYLWRWRRGWRCGVGCVDGHGGRVHAPGHGRIQAAPHVEDATLLAVVGQQRTARTRVA